MIKFFFSIFFLCLRFILYGPLSFYWASGGLLVLLAVYFSSQNLLSGGLNLLGYLAGVDSLGYRLIFLSF